MCKEFIHFIPSRKEALVIVWFVVSMYNIMVAQNDAEWKKKEPTLMPEKDDFFFQNYLK